MSFRTLWPPNLTQRKNSTIRARASRNICVGCGHVCAGSEVPRHCWQCGLPNGYALEEQAIEGTRSDELGELEPGVPVGDWLTALPQGLPLGCSMVLRGRPGAGKSRIAFRFASEIGNVSALTLEMGKVLSADSARKAGARMDRFWWYDDVDKGIDELAVVRPSSAIVDSIQKLGRRRASVIERLKRWAKDESTNLILVSQQGRHGVSRHGEDDDFDCDVVVDVQHATNQGIPRKEVHGFEEERTPCRKGCAHLVVVKSRVCPLIAFDVPIVKGA